MSGVGRAFGVELVKARRSLVPLLTALAFSIAPLVGGFFMIVIGDPDLARRLGLISTKAQIMAGEADWPTFLGLLAQAIAVGGILLFSLIATWVFGREHADRTIRDLLALPTPRSSIVLAKFILVALWSGALAGLVYLIGLGVGAAVGLPAASAETFRDGTITVAISAVLTIALVTPIAFLASAGRGYLPPMGGAMLALVLAQIVAAAGWGEYFPWSVAALYAGMAGPEHANPRSVSYALVLLTGLAGLIATILWWERADQTE
ncbi:MAG TPA: ABC transporter permease [Thermoanaerobaculia bacterium]|nr:ABC transporter permease [Thermoanaerobaculia bacterium]